MIKVIVCTYIIRRELEYLKKDFAEEATPWHFNIGIMSVKSKVLSLGATYCEQDGEEHHFDRLNNEQDCNAKSKLKPIWPHFSGGCVPHGFPKVGSRERIFLEKLGKICIFRVESLAKNTSENAIFVLKIENGRREGDMSIMGGPLMVNWQTWGPRERRLSWKMRVPPPPQDLTTLMHGGWVDVTDTGRSSLSCSHITLPLNMTMIPVHQQMSSWCKSKQEGIKRWFFFC